MNFLKKIFGKKENEDVYNIIVSLEHKTNKNTLKFNFFYIFFIKIYITVLSFWELITRQIPSPEKLINLAEDIIRNYKTAPMFNKIELLQLIGKKYSYLNKHYFIYLNYGNLLGKFLEKKYLRYIEFWLSDSIDKIMNYIKYYKQYFALKKIVYNKLLITFGGVFFLLISILSTIGIIVFTDYFFFSEGTTILPRDYFYNHMTDFRKYLFDNTYGIFMLFGGGVHNANIKNINTTDIIIYNILFYIGVFLVLFLLTFLVLYIISQNNLLRIYKYHNEKNFMIWLGIKLEKLKTFDKKTGYVSYNNKDLGSLLLENTVETHNWGLINERTKNELLKFISLGIQGIPLDNYENKKFFSPLFIVFWIRIFDIYNLSLLGQTKFNNKYLHQKVNEWLKEFNEIREIEVKKVLSILNMILLLLSGLVIGFVSLYQMIQVDDITKTIEVYYSNLNK